MLEELLRLITESGYFRPAQMARKLGVSEALVDRMVEDLIKGGQLEPVEKCPHEGCSHCPAASACSPPKTRLWTVGGKTGR